MSNKRCVAKTRKGVRCKNRALSGHKLCGVHVEREKQESHRRRTSQTSQVLIVEDDRQLSEVLAYNISAEGYDTIAAYDGQEGLNLARLHLPDLICLDVMLPVVDGLEVLRQLRTGVTTQSIPVVLLTAKAGEIDEIVGLRMVADEYISKPFSVRVLLERIRKCLKTGREFQEPATSQMSVVPLFQSRDFQRRTRTAFVLMPFTPKWALRVWNHLGSICTKARLRPLRADQMRGPNILEDIWVGINEASVVIADLTGLNANVMYEVGIAHTLGKPTILLTQNVNAIPFDFRGYRHIVYEDNVDGFSALSRLLPLHLTQMVK